VKKIGGYLYMGSSVTTVFFPRFVTESPTLFHDIITFHAYCLNAANKVSPKML